MRYAPFEILSQLLYEFSYIYMYIYTYKWRSRTLHGIRRTAEKKWNEYKNQSDLAGKIFTRPAKHKIANSECPCLSPLCNSWLATQICVYWLVNWFLYSAWISCSNFIYMEIVKAPTVTTFTLIGVKLCITYSQKHTKWYFLLIPGTH